MRVCAAAHDDSQSPKLQKPFMPMTWCSKRRTSEPDDEQPLQ